MEKLKKAIVADKRKFYYHLNIESMVYKNEFLKEHKDFNPSKETKFFNFCTGELHYQTVQYSAVISFRYLDVLD